MDKQTIKQTIFSVISSCSFKLSVTYDCREDKSGGEDESRLRSMIQTLNEEVQLLKK